MSTLKEVQEAINNAGLVDSLVELNLTDIKIGKLTPEIKKAIEKCKSLEILILSGCGLNSLDNLPESDLTAIDLTSNSLGDSQLAKLARFKNLGQLILNENNFTKLESIKCFSNLQNLQQLDFSDNPVTQQQKYRDFVLENLPKLQILDRFDRQGNEQIEEDQFEDDEDDEDEEDLDDDDEEEEDDQFDDDQQEQSPQPKKKR